MSKRCLRTEDGGLASRKMWFSAAVILVIVLAGLVLPVTALDAVIMGLVSVCAIYVGGNTATKWVLGKAKLGGKAKSPKPAEPPTPPAGE